MVCCYWWLGLCWVVGGLLWVGCSSAPQRPGPGPVEGRTSATEQPLTERQASKLAEAHAHYAAAVIHEVNEETEAALQEYYKAALTDAENESLTLEVSRRLLQAKQPEKALELLKRAAGRPQASGVLLARLGMVYSQLGKFEEAAAADRAATRKSPTSLSGYQNLFVTLLQNKQPQEALKVLDEAGSQVVSDPEFLINLAGLYLGFGVQVPAHKEAAKAKALALMNRAENLKPATPQLRMKLADGYNEVGETAKAAQLYLELLNTLPDLPIIRERMRAKLAEIYLNGQDHQKAVEQLQAIVRDAPTNPQAYYFLGSIAYEDKKPAEAAENFSKTILLSPGFEQAYYDLAKAQLTMNKPADALATLEQARKRFSQNFVLEFLAGMAFSRQKGYTEAIQHYTAAEVIAQATEPKRLNEAFYFQFGAACERKGDYAQAEKYFDKCLQIAPDFAEAMNYLGYMWAEHGTNLPQAQVLIEKALKLEPKNAAYLDSLGWVLFKLKQPAQALNYVRKAAGLLEEPDATVYDHLGDIYSALQQPEEARKAWTKSLSVEPNEEIRKKLEAVAGK